MINKIGGNSNNFKNKKLPPKIQVHDMINKIDDGSGVLNFEDFKMVRQISFAIIWINAI